MDYAFIFPSHQSCFERKKGLKLVVAFDHKNFLTGGVASGANRTVSVPLGRAMESLSSAHGTLLRTPITLTLWCAYQWKQSCPMGRKRLLQSKRGGSPTAATSSLEQKQFKL